MKTIYFCVTYLCLFLISCNKQPNLYSSDYDVDIIRSQNKEFEPLQELSIFENIKIIPLETTNDNLIGNIKEIKIKDSLIFISDANENLFVFNTEGQFLNKIGSIGDGPEEYSALGTFFIDEVNNQIIIMNQIKFTFITYGFDGQYKFKTTIPKDAINMPNTAFIIENNYLLANYFLTPKNNIAYKLLSLKNAGILQEKNYNSITVSDHLFAFSRHPVTSTEKGADFIMPLCDTIFNCYNKEFKPKYKIEHFQSMAPSDKYQANINKTIYSLDYEFGQADYFTGFKDLFETKKHILLNYNAFGYQSAYFIANKERLTGNYFLHTGIENANEFVAPAIEDTITKMPFFKINTTDGRSFISLIQPFYLLLYKDKFKESTDENLSNLKKITDILLEEDNPVLIFYTLKDDF
ncbi:MAG: 6-bladed beta-propeller [Dysgonamonadaceae bacterium]|jgi:hypothetical protein|nr:6-bladed beta-propeller [Dysgonamonadaceae bacterium]